MISIFHHKLATWTTYSHNYATSSSRIAVIYLGVSLMYWSRYDGAYREFLLHSHVWQHKDWNMTLTETVESLQIPTEHHAELQNVTGCTDDNTVACWCGFNSDRRLFVFVFANSFCMWYFEVDLEVGFWITRVFIYMSCNRVLNMVCIYPKSSRLTSAAAIIQMDNWLLTYITKTSTFVSRLYHSSKDLIRACVLQQASKKWLVCVRVYLWGFCKFGVQHSACGGINTTLGSVTVKIGPNANSIVLWHDIHSGTVNRP